MAAGGQRKERRPSRRRLLTRSAILFLLSSTHQTTPDRALAPVRLVRRSSLMVSFVLRTRSPMKHAFVAFSLLALFTCGWSWAGEDTAPPPTVAKDEAKPESKLTITWESLDPNQRVVIQGEKLVDALRKLTREAGLNVVMSKEIAQMKESITLILADKSPREALRILASGNGLVWDEVDGVVCLKTIGEHKAWNSFSHHEARQESLARPRTAQAIAEAKKILFEALLEEKFTREEALRIVMEHRPARPDPVEGGPKPKKNQPRAATERPARRTKPGSKPSRVFAFEEKEVAEIFRMLAREIGMNLVVSEQIVNERPTVTLRIEGKSPREVLEILTKANALQMDEMDGVFYVKRRNDQIRRDIGYREWVLEYEARPDAARKVAKAKRALFEALLAAKFTREEALQLVIANEEPDVPESVTAGAEK
jgi:hypothetical protein